MKLSVTMMSYHDRVVADGLSVEAFIELSAGLGVDAVDILEYFWQDKEKRCSAFRAF